MQEVCHRCGGELAAGSGESPFCPHCGAPQLFLAMENQSAETGGDAGGTGGGEGVVGEMQGAASTGAMPPPRPKQVEWRTAIQCAAAVAGVGALLSIGAMRVAMLSTLTLMWIVSASLLTLGLYQRRRPAAWMDVRVGARIGVVVGVCLALALGAAMAGEGLVSRNLLNGMGDFDAGMAAKTAEAIRNSKTPVPPEMLGFLGSQEFRAGMMLVCFGFVSACLLALSTVFGAFGGLMRTRRGPAV
jgi:hypothetical protein